MTERTCRKWRLARLCGRYGCKCRSRIVCSLPRYHQLPHKSKNGWYWWDRRWDRFSLPERDWVCCGLLGGGSRCGRTIRAANEDHIRVKGWKAARLSDGGVDVMCPDCGKPDPVTVKLCRDLEKSIQRVAS